MLSIFIPLGLICFKIREHPMNRSLTEKNDLRKAAKHSVVYQIIGGRLFRSPEKCLFPLRCRGVEHFLSKLAPKFERDSEFVVNFHDWPHISERFRPGKPLPLFSFSKTADYSDVFYPAWTFWYESSP